MSDVARERIAQARQTRARSLDLGKSGLRSLQKVPELFECDWLEELVLSDHWIEWDGGGWVERTCANPKGRGNQLARIPPELGRLGRLRKLVCAGHYLNNWEISDLSFLSGLRELEWVHLAGNRITDATPFAGLRRLRYLNLNKNYVEDLGPLSGLTELTDLALLHNRVRDVSPLRALPKLARLHLTGNPVVDPPVFSAWPNLTVLEAP